MPDPTGAPAYKPYLVALASGPDGHLVAEVPLESDSQGRIKAVKGKSLFNGTPDAWQPVAKYTDHPVSIQSRIVTEYPSHSKTKEPVEFTHREFDSLPKLQDMTALPDNSLAFTVERSHVLIKAPADQPDILDISLDMSTLATKDFDKLQEYNKDYGISLAYDNQTKLLYISFEGRIFVLDVEKARQGASATIKLCPQPGQMPEGFQPLTGPDNTCQYAEANSSIITLALTKDSEGNACLFNSYTADHAKDGPVPVNMSRLTKDGLSVVETGPAPFAVPLQFARTSNNPSDGGLKRDFTYLAIESDPEYPPVMAMHGHHNQPVVVSEPQARHPAIDAKVQALRESDTLNAETMNPMIFNEMVRPTNDSVFHPSMYRLHNVGYVESEFFKSDEFSKTFRPNAYAEVDRVTSRTVVGKAPKLWLGNDYLKVSQGQMMVFPWRYELPDKVYAHPIPANLKGDMINQPEQQWYQVTSLPEVGLSEGTPAYQVTPDRKLIALEDKGYREINPAAPRSQGLHWSAFCIQYK
ncbi:hypothetical protein [Endozoicomonas lisbonensis]|uniref:Uncharacterized protein n=1 Tax=Endozoicomonas lisbonensis TaxID=3120522 RepID=A0ABV2SJV3_9GAMM